MVPNLFVPSRSTPFQKNLLWKPDDIEQSRSIPAALKLQPPVRWRLSDEVARIDEPCFLKNVITLWSKCGHIEKDGNLPCHLWSLNIKVHGGN